MPQLMLPIFPEGCTYITPMITFTKKDGKVTYFNGVLPVFFHAEDDIRSFRMFTSLLCVNGSTKQVDITKVFGVPAITVKRSVKLFQEKGPPGFFQPRRSRGPAVLIPSVLAEAQEKLDEGLSHLEVADQLSLKRDTVRKAIGAGRLHRPKQKTVDPVDSTEAQAASTKSERSIEDSQAPIGMGATNTLDRLATSLGASNGVMVKFQPALDVPSGGVLFALPALLACGLLKHTKKHFSLPKGYYQIASIFLFLAFMALCRLRSVEQIRFKPPGEWGKILGLDRSPEARTLRNKIHILSEDGQPMKWSADLCAQWMEASPEDAHCLYIDGHVRVYHGNQTKLPRHYVARQRLCLRATTDYWVNAMDGQPFFLVNMAIDPGLIKVLEEDIVPRLEKEVPNQPTEKELEADPLLHRFTLVFDREGYSPDFFKKMKERRIACLTYHKFPGEAWPDDEFQVRKVKLVSGEVVEMALAERGTYVGNKLWVREVRKKKKDGGQTSILSTDYHMDLAPMAAAMFARWSQENYFCYMREHYGLDRLADYGTEDIPGTVRVVNPDYRKLDGQVRRNAAILSRKLAEFGGMNLNEEIAPKKVEQYQRIKGELREEITQLQVDIEGFKQKRKATVRHITVAQLPEKQRFSRLSTQTKHFIDTIKMIAYRAETSMVHIVREQMARNDDARSLLRSIYSTDADLLPDEDNATLTVRLHHLANHATDETLRHLCAELNETETIFPGTNLRLIFELVSSQNR